VFSLWLGTSLIKGEARVPAERRRIECCDSGYPELKTLQ